MSRNENRLGLPESPQQDETPAPVAANTEAPAFNWSVPTEFVELPSKGLFYSPGHPLHNVTTTEIRYMTAKEEDILTSRSLLKEGVALDRMLQNLLVDKTINVSSLLIGDKNALLVAARRTGYGPEYETNVTCPACDNSETFSFDITEPPIKDINENCAEVGATILEDGTVRIQLPLTKAVVTCRFMTGADEVKITKEMERKSKKKIEAATTDIFRTYITSVNGDDSIFTIESFIQAMPARDARHLRKTYTAVVPDINLNQAYDCGNCGYEADMEVPLGVDFFWPG